MRALGALWEIAALAFLIGVGNVVRVARRRGERLFRDEPLERVKALHHSTVDHTQDAL